MSTIMTSSGLSTISNMTIPAEMVTIIENVGFLESIPLWAVTLLGSLIIWVLSLVMILTVYSRFFKIYMATAIAPIPLSSFAGQPSSSIGVAFLKSYATICMEGCVIVLACVIFSAFATTPPCSRLHRAILQDWFPLSHPPQCPPKRIVHSPQLSPHRENNWFLRVKPFTDPHPPVSIGSFTIAVDLISARVAALQARAGFEQSVDLLSGFSAKTL